jgi:TonB family protein
MPNFAARLLLIVLLSLAVWVPCFAEMRVGAQEAMKAAVKKVHPDYNPIAKQMRVQGDVEVEARVSDAGEVTEVNVLTGNALLTPTVIKAVKDWRFQPFQENGKPIQALATLRFTFKL